MLFRAREPTMAEAFPNPKRQRGIIPARCQRRGNPIPRPRCLTWRFPPYPRALIRLISAFFAS
ncbi:MAG: hypothetical protein ACK53L_19405, partial [Pirellulaceae bacterium]